MDTPLPGRSMRLSGWLIGIICGVGIGLWALPPVRHTLAAQLSFACAEDGMPWIGPLDARHSRREAPVLDAAAARAPDDYLIQIGRATALIDAEADGARGSTAGSLTTPDSGDRALLRLTVATSDFPANPGACAHLARYMMRDRVRLIRAELAGPAPSSATHTQDTAQPDMESEAMPGRTIPATHRDVRLMEWALRRGEHLEPDNAFWPAMLATTYFAANRDRDALHELRRLNHTTRWDAYLYEEILGQWRLYSLAYGDHGAAQKIGPLSFIAFPHLREIRHMAQLARWYAERAALRGHVDEALQIRRSVARLGRTMRETASWAYEALYGTELILIADTDSEAAPNQTGIQTVAEWKPKAARFLALLIRSRRRAEVSWVTQEIEASCKLRQAVNLARSDASYPGIPPGIPLAPLFGDWMAGVSLIQQCLALALSALLATLCLRYRVVASSARAYRLLLPVVLALTALDSGLLFLGVPSERLASAFLILTALIALLLLDLLYFVRRPAERRSATSVGTGAQVESPLSFDGAGAEGFAVDWAVVGSGVNGSEVHGSEVNGSGVNESGVKGPEVVDAAMEALRGKSLWGRGAMVQTLLMVLVPGLVALALLRPTLSGLHPVAILLTRWFGVAVAPSAGDMLLIALLAGALPLALALVAAIRGLARNVQPTLAALTGLRRMALPALVCLIGVYLVLLQRTLVLDTQASGAINEAARNDRQWVLTHTIEDDTP